MGRNVLREKQLASEEAVGVVDHFLAELELRGLAGVEHTTVLPVFRLEHDRSILAGP